MSRHIGTSRFLFTKRKRNARKKMQVIYSHNKEKQCQAIYKSKKKYREYATHGKLDTILLYRTRPHTHTLAQKPSEKEIKEKEELPWRSAGVVRVPLAHADPQPKAPTLTRRRTNWAPHPKSSPRTRLLKALHEQGFSKLSTNKASQSSPRTRLLKALRPTLLSRSFATPSPLTLFASLSTPFQAFPHVRLSSTCTSPHSRTLPSRLCRLPYARASRARATRGTSELEPLSPHTRSFPL